LVVEGRQLGGDGDGVECLASQVEEGVRCEAGAGAVCLPLVAEQACVGVEVAVVGGVLRAAGVGAVLGKGTGGVLRPEAVEDEGEVLRALGCGGVGVAELGGPGEVEEIEVEVLLRGGCRLWLLLGAARSRLRGCWLCWVGGRVAAEGCEEQEENCRDCSVLHCHQSYVAFAAELYDLKTGSAKLEGWLCIAMLRCRCRWTRRSPMR
jgi:hypothetical protein